ncbi:MAG: hypothetical protein MSL80_04015 [Helicobacter sp.]|uniref:hypothetical protein n=1 Tax=Helicobacter sp. TaxID=218 RepID=UPI00375006BE|nr:hypothetical protein [Helicobacter sp.]
MKKLLVAFIFIVIVGILVFVALRILKSGDLSQTPFSVPSAVENMQTAEIEQDDMWLRDLSTSSSDAFQYPTTELFVKFDFRKDTRDNIVHSIEIKDLDEYKYFCIAQVLKQNKLESTYYKSGEVLRLMVFIDDELVLQKFLQDLQYYRIQYTLN